MEEIMNLLFDLQTLNEETKSTHIVEVLRELRNIMEFDMVSVLRKANVVRVHLESRQFQRISTIPTNPTEVVTNKATLWTGLAFEIKTSSKLKFAYSRLFKHPLLFLVVDLLLDTPIERLNGQNPKRLKAEEVEIVVR
ncbi:hypothetical protein L6452_44110 [Arctium lappa]|uniref:Uncharacterized protein n=1 Tax=Arctium lappa TaxID=4217 RepID=A0ACB8XFI1_ARCLA|nr:hypothetical protein L6452_44110 [Arctium lappa]